MSEWMLQAPALAASVLVVFTPGLLIGWALGIRGLALWALSPVISTAVLTTSALVFGLVGVGWRPLPASAATAAAAVVVFVVRKMLRLGVVPAAASDRLRFAVGAALVLGVTFTAARVGAYIGSPDAVSQTNDGAFHLNALRYAVETGAASPLDLTGVIGARGFYPSGWHVWASLVPQLTGAGVEVAANTISLVIAAVVWPLGIAYLTRSLAGSLAAAIATSLAGVIPAFPLVLIQWGVLYPQLLAVAMLPAALGVVVGVTGLGSGDGHPAARIGRIIVIFCLCAVAIGLAQPSVLLAWLAACGIFAVFALIQGWGNLRRVARWVAVVAVIVGGVAAGGVWLLFSASVSSVWPATAGNLEAAGEILSNGYLGYPPVVIPSILMILGLVVAALRAQSRWLAVSWAVFAGLYFISAAVSSPTVRSVAVGSWYEDPYRLAAMTPALTLPLVGLGGAWIVTWVSRVIAKRRGIAQASDSRAPAVITLGVVAALGIVTLAIEPAVDRRDVFADRTDPNLYRVTATSFVSHDEIALLHRLDTLVPDDAVVIANPGTGAAFGYALSSRDVIPRTWNPPSGEAYSTLWTSLRNVATDPAVCPALDAFGAEYVLDFGPGEEYPGRWVMPGFTELAGQPGFELVAAEGAASLWRVTACDQVGG